MKQPEQSSVTLAAYALSVSSNGSTWVKPIPSAATAVAKAAFSILERIDVGETLQKGFSKIPHEDLLSVSSNGSTWVKLMTPGPRDLVASAFQYPRTDRRG